MKSYEGKIITKEFIEKYKGKQPEWGYNGLGLVVYKRTYSRDLPDGQKEEWWQTVARCVNGAQEIGAGYTEEEAQRLYDHVFNLRCNFAGRMLWQLGTDNYKRYKSNAYLNCWFRQINTPEAFCFLFENLMLGGGVGFSVRREDVHELPKVKENVIVTHENKKDSTFIVPDSREGWVNLLRKVLRAYFQTGIPFSYSTILIRGYGEKINGFGGTASGPGILVDGITNICKVMDSRAGKKLRSVDALDICNIIGSIVVAGNVRRSAQISLGDPDDYLFIRAKRWDLHDIPNWRSLSNNTIYADDFTHISNDIWDGYAGNGEPYGLFNLKLSQKVGRLGEHRKDNCTGTNPCITGDTLIVTPHGLREVRSLTSKKFDTYVDGKLQTSTKDGFWSNGYKDVYKIVTSHGFEFKATDNHKILLSNGEWRQLKSLKIGDNLVINNSRRDVEECEYFNEFDKGWIVGEVLGDGCYNPSKYRGLVRFWGKESEFLAKKAYSFINGVSKPCYNKTNKTWQLQSVNIDEICSEYLTDSKEITKSLLQESRGFIRGFLRGVFDADSFVGGNPKKEGISIQLSQNNKQTLMYIQNLLIQFGIVSSIYKMSRPEELRLMPDGHGGKKEYECKQGYRLDISRDNIELFNKYIGYYTPSKQETLNRIISEKSKSSYKTKFETKIVSIEFIGNEEVFDCTINKVHCFGANGIVVHNCAEISLSDSESCNLIELYLNNIQTKEQFIDCSKLLYKTQKAICAMPFLHEETNKIVHKNMRIGQGITGICQSLDKLEWLDDAYKQLREFDVAWSKERGWNESIKLTTVKPSGTLSLLAGSTPGVHPAFSRYYIRRVRMASDDLLVEKCKEAGYHVEFALGFDGTIDHKTSIVSFPCFAGEKAIIAKDMSAITQLDLVKKMQTIWADNAVSVTVYYKKEDLPDIKEWLKKNYKDCVKSVSFLLHSEHGFAQAPYEEITEEKYKELSKYIKPIKELGEWDSRSIDVGECATGACPIK